MLCRKAGFISFVQQQTSSMILSLIVAIDQRNGIGKDNKLLWHLPADLKHFKSVTSGHTVIMGRKTFESIGRALPNRRNIVLSRDAAYKAEGCEVLNNLHQAIDACNAETSVYIIGGAEIYRQALPIADVLHITRVNTVAEADTFFPEIDPEEWDLSSAEMRLADEKNAYDCNFEIYRRKKA